MNSFRDLWVNVTYSNIYVMIVSEGEVRKKRAEKTFEEKIAENFPKLMKNMNIQIQEVQ